MAGLVQANHAAVSDRVKSFIFLSKKVVIANKKYPGIYLKNNIAGRKTILRKLEEKDLGRSLVWLKDPCVNKFLSQDFKNLTMEHEIQWFRRVQDSQKDIVFAIDTKDSHVYIGNCDLRKIDRIERSCELGIVIGEKKYWNKGYGLDAINSLIDFAFNKLNLRCIKLNVYKYNHRAIKLYKKCGFKEKKVLKKNHFYDGKYWDTFVMDIDPERF